ncbi:MAG: ComEC family competence protein [Clostridiales bacterium]|nr:ComEC family competence protein [Clostridiales bacterium]
MKQRYLFYCLLAIIAGIIITISVSFRLIIALILFIVSVILFILFKRFNLWIILSIVCSITIVYTNFLYVEHTTQYTNATITGKIASYHPNDYGYAIYLENCDISDTSKTDNINVYAYLTVKDAPSLKEGFTVKCFGKLNPVKFVKNSNPGEVLPQLSAYADGTSHTMNIKKITVINNEPDLNYYFSQFKEQIRKTIFKNVPTTESASVLYAMITADRYFISSQLYESFSQAGTSHLLAVSGLHISILISLLSFIMKKLKANDVVFLIILAVFTVIYSLFTGLSPSVLRASVMACALNCALVFSNRYDSVNALGLAGIFILLLNPFVLFDVSFQLSFLACFGIVVFTKYQIRTRIRILNFIYNSALITLGATVFTLPLQVYYYGEIPVITILANLIAVPLVSFSLSLGFISVLLSFLFSGAGFVLKIAGYILQGAISVIKFCSGFPQLSLAPISAFIAVVLIIIAVFFTRFIRANKKKIVAGVLLLTIIFCSIFSSFYKNNTLQICVPYTQKNTLCAHIKGKKSYVIGLNNDYQYLLRNAKNIDYLFLLTESDMEIFDNLNKNINIKNIFVAPSVIISKKARLHKATHIDTPVTLPDGIFCFISNGVVFEDNVNKIFVGNGARNTTFTVAITNDTLVKGKTVISNGISHKFNQTFYDIQSNGYTNITLRRYNEPY